MERSVSALTAALLEQQTGFRGYELTGDEAFLRPYDEGRSAQQAAELAFRSADDHDPTLEARIKAVSDAASAWRREWVSRVIPLVQAGKLDEVRAQVESGQGEAYFTTVRASLDALGSATRGPADAVNADVQTVTGFVVIMGIVAILSTVVVLAGLALYLGVAVWRPLAELVRTTERIDKGQPASFEARRGDEIGVLARALERLHRDLQGRYETASEQAARAVALNELSESLNLAADERGLIESCAETLRRIVAVDGGEILLLTSSGDQLLRRSSWGEEPANLDSKAFRSSGCPVVRTGRALATTGGKSIAGLDCDVRSGRDTSHACIPLAAMGRKIGVIHVYRSDPAADFSPADLQLISQVGTQVALVVANRRLVADLEKMAMTDPLTGIKNARFFDAYLERELAAALRERRSLGLIMLDVDHFKEFNDAYGHPAGDEALRTLTATIEATIRTSDTLARYGGEEFIVCIRSADLEETVQVAEKLRVAVQANPVRFSDGRQIPLSASFGVANSANHGADRETLVLRADQALYLAKQLGRNRVELPPPVGTPPPAVRGMPTAPRSRRHAHSQPPETRQSPESPHTPRR